MSVPSQGQYVLHSVLLTLRKPISPQDRNRPRPLVRPSLPGPPRRSMSASTTRLARHSIPLSLSIVARPHGAGLICSWRADSLAFVWLDPGITPCCKSRKSKDDENLANVDFLPTPPLQYSVAPIRSSVIVFARSDVVPHIAASETHQRS